MKKRLQRLLILLVVSANCFSSSIKAASLAVISIHRDADGVSLTLQSGTLRLQVFSAGVIRVRYSAENSSPQTKSFTVISQPSRIPWRIVETSEEVRLRTDASEVRVNRASGAVSFYDVNRREVLVEGARSLTPNQIGNLKTLKSRQEFLLAADEAIFGLGQHQAGVMNYRNSIVHLQQENMRVAVPFLVSSRGYGCHSPQLWLALKSTG